MPGRRHLRRPSSSWMSADIASCHLWSIPAVNRRPISAPAFLARTFATRWLHRYPRRRHLLHPAHHIRRPARRSPYCAIQVHHKIDAHMHIAAIVYLGACPVVVTLGLLTACNGSLSISYVWRKVDHTSKHCTHSPSLIPQAAMGPSEVPWAAAAVAAYLLLRVLQFARCAYHYLYTTSPSNLPWS